MSEQSGAQAMQFGIMSVSDITRDPTTGITPSEQERINVEHTLRYAAVGSKATISDHLDRFTAATGADEIIVSMPIHDVEARLRSLELFADVRDASKAAA